MRTRRQARSLTLGQPFNYRSRCITTRCRRSTTASSESGISAARAPVGPGTRSTAALWGAAAGSRAPTREPPGARAPRQHRHRGVRCARPTAHTGHRPWMPGAAVVVMSRTCVRPPTSGRADDRSVDNATMVDRGEWAVDAHPRGRRAELTYEPGAKANPALLRHARGAGRPPWVRSVGTAR